MRPRKLEDDHSMEDRGKRRMKRVNFTKLECNWGEGGYPGDKDGDMEEEEGAVYDVPTPAPPPSSAIL